MKRKHLFLDEEGIGTLHNAKVQSCKAKQYDMNPAIPLGRIDEWDAMRAAPWSVRTVLHDPSDGLFQCWYTGRDLNMKPWRRDRCQQRRRGEVNQAESRPRGLSRQQGQQHRVLALGLHPQGRELTELRPPFQDGYEADNEQEGGLRRRLFFRRNPLRRRTCSGSPRNLLLRPRRPVPLRASRLTQRSAGPTLRSLVRHQATTHPIDRPTPLLGACQFGWVASFKIWMSSA